MRYMRFPAMCDISFLLTASIATYRVDSKSNTLDDDSYKKIKAKNYIELNIKKPADVNALCFKPSEKNDNAPIVIAFRGTFDTKDVATDIHIAKKGYAEQKRRDAAYALYKEVQKKYPGKEIVLVGHSLGGNLAQDVGVRAKLDDQVSKKPMVRTINSAPLETEEAEKLLEKTPKVFDDFVNYRLDSDIVSNIPGRKCYGDFHHIYSGKYTGRPHSAHFLSAVDDVLPKELREAQIGSSDKLGVSRQTARVLENISGLRCSYESRVKGQYFSFLRQGSKNEAHMYFRLPLVEKNIRLNRYSEARKELNKLASHVKGTQSNKIINIIKEDIDKLDPCKRNLIKTDLKETIRNSSIFDKKRITRKIKKQIAR